LREGVTQAESLLRSPLKKSQEGKGNRKRKSGARKNVKGEEQSPSVNMMQIREKQISEKSGRWEEKKNSKAY